MPDNVDWSQAHASVRSPAFRRGGRHNYRLLVRPRADFWAGLTVRVHG